MDELKAEAKKVMHNAMYYSIKLDMILELCAEVGMTEAKEYVSEIRAMSDRLEEIRKILKL